MEEDHNNINNEILNTDQKEHNVNDDSEGEKEKMPHWQQNLQTFYNLHQIIKNGPKWKMFSTPQIYLWVGTSCTCSLELIRFQKCFADNCLMKKNNKNRTEILCIYVDWKREHNN